MDKRNLSLENQIEKMIDTVIKDDQGDSILQFSDDNIEQKQNNIDSNEQIKQLINQSHNQINLNTEQQQCNPLIQQNQISFNTQQQKSNQSFQRAKKKHQTISYQSYPLPYVNNMMAFDPSPYSKPINNYNMFNDNRQNLSFFNNNYNNNNQQQQKVQSPHPLQNRVKFAYPVGTYYHPIEIHNQSKFFNINMGYENPLSLQQKPLCKNIRKKFCTTVVPQGTNMQLEMILYEMGVMLSKTEKIDHFIYNKLQNNFVAIVQTHKGSRIFQNYLKNTHNEIIHLIFTELMPSLTILMKNSYGNYFCKKFFNFLNQKDKLDFLVQVSELLLIILYIIK